MMLFLFSMLAIPKIISTFKGFLLPFALLLPWPWLCWFVGAQPDGSFSFISSLVICWLAASFVTAIAVWLSLWGANRGLAGNTGRTEVMPKNLKVPQPSRFRTDPLYRKELLWFRRDRSAIVQTILIPLTLAGAQLFNLRGVAQVAQGAWNYLSGAAVVFGTYFLWILGPRSLTSEGPALWLPLTWPRGMESLLKAKARLWSIIANGVVALILLYAVIRFPQNTWKILIAGIANALLFKNTGRLFPAVALHIVYNAVMVLG